MKSPFVMFLNKVRSPRYECRSDGKTSHYELIDIYFFYFWNRPQPSHVTR